MDIGIVIPIYNQYESLIHTLNGFKHQNDKKFRLVIVDDGSEDLTRMLTDYDIKELAGENATIIHQKNGGRAIARNIGIIHCDCNYIIFNDGDRVPDSNLVQEYRKECKRNTYIQVGSPYDFFGLNEYDLVNLNWTNIYKYSRLSWYYKRVTAIYGINSINCYSKPWLSFLVGNACVKRSILFEVGLFDEIFKEWGFEHFELAYRMYKTGLEFYINKKASNFHLPHKRENNFYNEMIIKNTDILTNMHPEIIKDEILNTFGIVVPDGITNNLKCERGLNDDKNK